MNRELSIIERSVLSIIPRGKDNRKTLKTISQSIDLKPRELYSVINGLVINHHIPIVAIRKGGYYIPLTESELIDGLQGLKNQTNDQLRRISIVEATDIENWQSNILGGVFNE